MRNLTQNLLASFVLLLIAIPLNLGIALASGVSPSSGLITGLIAALVVGSLAGCPLQISAPATGLIAVVWEIIDHHGLEMLGPIVLVAGLLQIALGVSKLAPWFRAVSPAVIQGMLAGIGILIFASQLQVVLERQPQTSGLANLLGIFPAVVEMIATGKGRDSALVGALTILTIVIWTRFAPRKLQIVPGSLAGALLAISTALLFSPNIRYVNLPANPLSELHLIPLNFVGKLTSGPVIGSILALAFIATAQTLLTATAVDRLHAFERTDYNKEIIAQGAGNTVCGLVGVMPVCGVIVRSSANVAAGATGRSSNVMHGVWLGLVTVFLAPLLNYVPLTALAGILVYTGFKLVNVRAIQELKKFGRSELVIYAVTLLAVVLIDLLSGVLLGCALSAGRLVYVLTHCETTVRDDEVSGSVVVELQGSATFINLPRLADTLSSLAPRREVHLFMSGLNHIDHACLEHLMAWEELYIQQGGQVFIEWDHLITRLHRPLTKEIGLEYVETRFGSKSYETFDVLAARASVIDLESAQSWDEVAKAIAGVLETWVPEEQTKMVVDRLNKHFQDGSFLTVSGVLIPHLMVAGISRRELIMVRFKEGLDSLDPQLAPVHCLVALIGPPKTSEHLAILARLTNRAEEGLANQITEVTSRQSLRKLLLRNSRFVALPIDSSGATADLVGMAVWQIAKELPSNTLLAHIDRDGEELIPGGSTILEHGDRVLILGTESAVAQIFERYIKIDKEAV